MEFLSKNIIKLDKVVTDLEDAEHITKVLKGFINTEKLKKYEDLIQLSPDVTLSTRKKY